MEIGENLSNVLMFLISAIIFIVIIYFGLKVEK